MTQRLFIHIGYHKTATTWMQRLLFVPAHGYYPLANHDQIFAHITRPHGLRFDPAPMRQIIAEGLAKVPKTGVPVLSSELLCGNPFFGGRESDVFAERLKVIAPNARILISIRAQLQILPSIYMQYLSRGGTMSCKQFFEAQPMRGYSTFDSGHFEYDHLVAHYQSLFGAENVHVLTQESIKADMAAAATQLAKFSGNVDFHGLVPEAHQIRMASYPEHAAPFLRRANHVQRSIFCPNPIFSLGETPGGLYQALGYVLKTPVIARRLKGYRPVTSYVRQHFVGRFTDSNARLAVLTGGTLDLSKYT
jgi:hypothetical protein